MPTDAELREDHIEAVAEQLDAGRPAVVPFASEAELERKDARAYGASPTASTEANSAALMEMLADIAVGSIAGRVSEHYPIEPLLIDSSLGPYGGHVEFGPGGVFDISAQPINAKAITLQGRRAVLGDPDWSLLTANVAAGDRAVTPASAAAFAPGDFVKVASTKLIDPVRSNTAYGSPPIRVQKVAGGIVTLSRPVEDAYATADAAYIMKVELLPEWTFDGMGTILGGGLAGPAFTLAQDLPIDHGVGNSTYGPIAKLSADVAAGAPTVLAVSSGDPITFPSGQWLLVIDNEVMRVDSVAGPVGGVYTLTIGARGLFGTADAPHLAVSSTTSQGVTVSGGRQLFYGLKVAAPFPGSSFGALSVGSEVLTYNSIVNTSGGVTILAMRDRGALETTVAAHLNGDAGTVDTTHIGIAAQAAYKPKWEGLRFIGLNATGGQMSDCVDGLSKKNHYYESMLWGSGYGVSIADGCDNCWSEDDHFDMVRHAVTSGSTGGQAGQPHDCGARGGILRRSIFGGDGFDTHAAARRWLYDAVRSLNADGHGVNVECADGAAIDAVVINPRLDGVHFANCSQEPTRHKIINPTVRGIKNVNNVAIRMSSASIPGAGATQREVSLSGYTVDDCAGLGIYIAATDTVIPWRMVGVRIGPGRIGRCGKHAIELVNLDDFQIDRPVISDIPSGFFAVEALACNNGDINVIAEAIASTSALIYLAPYLGVPTTHIKVNGQGGGAAKGVQLDDTCADIDVDGDWSRCTTPVVLGAGPRNRSRIPASRVVTANTTVLYEDDLIQVDASATSPALTLRSAANARQGQMWTIKLVALGTGRTPTLVAQAGETIDGAASYALSTRKVNDTLVLRRNHAATGWVIL
jgi:hypothetical protein